MSSSLSSLSIEQILLQYRLFTGKPYSGFVAVPPPPSPPTSSFNIIPQRPSKPQPCIILPHPSFPGVYVAGDHDDDDDDESSLLYTRNLVPGVQSLDQDVVFSVQDENEGTVEYREWDPFKSRLASAILSGAHNIWIKPGSRVLVVYSHSREDAHFGITISHISDIVGPQGMVYVVEESDCNCNSLLDMADKRFNIVPIVYGTFPYQYRMLINIVDVLFAAPDRPEEVRAAYLNARYFLKTGGHYMLYVQGNCIESTNRGDGVFSSLIKGQQVQFQRMERVTLEPFDEDHAYVSGVFRTLEVAKIDPNYPVSNKFWTSQDSHGGDGRHISLIEKLKDLPVYILFDSSCGYVLFRAHGVDDVERNYLDTEKYIKSCDKCFEVVACHTFASNDEALMYLTADGNDTVPHKLIEFLKQHLTSPMKDGEHCYSLVVFNPFMMDEIVCNLKIASLQSQLYIDITRGVRMNFDKFFKNMKPGDLEKAQVDLARIYSRQRLDSPDKGKLPKKRPFPTRRNPQRKARAVTKTK
ncbi:hypothetical protein P8452_23640 [Trifolium repens]|nr:hypothetical protein P8452_23640 [Trifolium repens]